MKNLVLFFVLFSAPTSFAATTCSEKLAKIINELDRAYSRIVGSVQGDDETTPLKMKQIASVKSADGSLDTYRVVGTHQNDEGNVWNDVYEITLANPGCYLETYQFLGSKNKK